MIVKKLSESEGIVKNIDIERQEKDVVDFLVENYGEDVVSEALEFLTEKYYPGSGTDYNFNRTGGASSRGVVGLLKSLPSFAISAAVSWPMTLIAALGALSYRFQKRWEDKTSKRQLLDMRWWVDYQATPRSEKKHNKKVARDEHKGIFGKDSSDSSDKTKTAAAAAAGALGGAAAAEYLTKDDKDKIMSEMKNDNFKEYWVTLSNGEILRLRADTDEHAKLLANLVMAYTVKSVYPVLNKKIKEGCPKYTFYFTDGEKCYWSAATKEDAYREALATRRELTDVMNKTFPNTIVMDKLDNPDLDGSPEISTGELIETPKYGSFKEVSTTKPSTRKIEQVKLPKPPYDYGVMSQYRIVYGKILMNVPAISAEQAKDIFRYFLQNNNYVEKMYMDSHRDMDVYRVTMNDGDRYLIPSSDKYGAERTAEILTSYKKDAVRRCMGRSERREYDAYVEKFDNVMFGVKSVEILDKKSTAKYSNVNKVASICRVNKEDLEKEREKFNI